MVIQWLMWPGIFGGWIGQRIGKPLQEAGGHWLSLKDVHNAGAAWKKENPDSRRDRSQGIWQEQALKVQEWLEKEGWHVDAIQVGFPPHILQLLNI